MVLDINRSFWDRGEFPQVINNGSDFIALRNPWTNGTLAAPFDKRTYSLSLDHTHQMNRCSYGGWTAFYLILNVAVGGTSGWFPDGYGDKPWLDGSLSM